MALRRLLNERRQDAFVGLVALVGAVLMVIGIVLYIMTSQFMAGSVTTTGFVAQLAPQNANDIQAAEYRTAIRYRAANNQEFILRQALRVQPRVGEPVPIIYRAADPQQAQVNNSVDIWRTTWTFLLAGALVMGVAGGIWWWTSGRKMA